MTMQAITKENERENACLEEQLYLRTVDEIKYEIKYSIIK